MQKLEAGLPNITGTFDAAELNHTGVGVPKTSGAFGYDTNSSFNWMSDGLSGKPYRIIFNASKSNSIYGANTTIQVPAIALIAQIKY